MRKEANIESLPIYKRLYLSYRDDIIRQKYPPGSLLPSINDLRQEHGISRETAKLVLKSLASDGLILQRAGKGSFVADLGSRKPAWGIVMPFLSPSLENLIARIKINAERSGVRTEYFFTYNNPLEEIRLVGELVNQRYQAILVIPVANEPATSSFYRKLVSGGTLVSMLDHTMAGSFFPYVIQSYDLGVSRAMDYLIRNTGKRIAFLRDGLWEKRNKVQEHMETTYRDCIRTSGRNGEPLILDDIGQVKADLFSCGGVGAVFCCNDRDAIRVIGRLSEEGLEIKRNYHLVSYGNTDLAKYFTPGITSVDCLYEKMADQLAGIIRMHLEGKDTSLCQYIVQPELVIRET